MACPYLLDTYLRNLMHRLNGDANDLQVNWKYSFCPGPSRSEAVHCQTTSPLNLPLRFYVL